MCDEKPQKSVSLFANYGDTVDLFCEASEMMAIWEFPIRGNIETRNEGEVVHIDNVTIENEGEYKCYKAGEATAITNLTVQGNVHCMFASQGRVPIVCIFSFVAK